MQKLLTSIVLCSTLSVADFIGGEFNLGYYNHAPNGTASYKGDTFDLENDLKLDTQSDIFFKGYIEHPIPFLPNIKVGYTNFTHSGKGKIANDFNFGNYTFKAKQNLESHLDLNIYDLAFYYEILDNWVNLDLGINVKYLSGEMSAETLVTGKETSELSLALPLLYVKARFDVPTTDLSFQLEGNYLTYDGHELLDLEVGARYTFTAGLGLEVGYKTFSLVLDEIDDTSMNADFSGVYGKVVWDF